MRKWIIVTACILPIFGISQVSESVIDSTNMNTKDKTFLLGEVFITAKRSSEMISRIGAEEMDNQNVMEVSKAVNMLPGVNLTASGARNESMVTVRGFDLRQVPIYMDGIPVYIPYDGYVDLARFTTFDLAAIDVSKGFSSILYGPNSLGGAINLISRKPIKKLEFDGSIGMINTNGYKGNINLGANFGKFYIQGGASYLHRNSYRLSSKFEAMKNEDGGERDNSHRTDQKYNVKVGWTPNENHEYVLGYTYQNGAKGVPVYAGDDPESFLLDKPRYWQWPQWNKETFYFLSNTVINSKNSVKARLYYDKFKNTLDSFDDATYTTQDKPSSFSTAYDDYSYGGSIEYRTLFLPRNDVKLAVHFKKDVHREIDEGEPIKRFEDNTITVGLEDVIKITDKFIAIPGVSYSVRDNIQADDYDKATNSVVDFPRAKTSHAVNGQIGLLYYFQPTHKLAFTFSRKTRFATIKDRYSYRMGTAIPNPDLKPENSLNFDLSYTGKFIDKINIQTAIFYSHINDAMLNVSNVEPGKSQIQNMGSARFYGAEAGVRYDILKNLMLGVNYTFVQRDNLTEPDVLFTDVPTSKVFGYVQYEPIKSLRFMANVEYNSSRYSTSYGIQTPQYTLLNFSASYKVWKYMSLEAGLNNIFDKNYSVVEGYPEEGRNFFVTLRFFNNK